MFRQFFAKTRARTWALGVLLLWAALPARAYDYDYRSFQSDGVRIAYVDYGSGTPVILLHGLNGSYEHGIANVGDPLSQQFRVIGIDQRGFGRSGKPHEGTAYGKHMATDVLNLMDHLKIRKAQVVGHSMGGIVAVYLAANHPQRFDSAVTIGNGLFTHGQLTLIGWLLKGMSAWESVKIAFGGTAFRLPGHDAEASVLAARNLKDLSVTDAQAAAIRIPVLAARGGEEDDPRSTAEHLVAVNPSVRFLRLEAENHMSILGSTIFQQELRQFLLRPTRQER